MSTEIGDRLQGLHDELRAFVAEREWAPFHDPKNLSMAVASEAGELLALFRWVPNADADASAREPTRAAKVAHEVADVFIALALLADRLGIDLVDAARAKLVVNRANYPVETSRGRSDRPPREP